MENRTIKLPETLHAWSQKNSLSQADAAALFKAVFIKEVSELEGCLLPLQEGLRQSSHALLDEFKVMVLSTNETDSHLDVKAGIFYAGIIAGCSCADDPTPINEHAEFCHCLFTIDKQTAVTRIQLIEE